MHVETGHLQVSAAETPPDSVHGEPVSNTARSETRSQRPVRPTESSDSDTRPSNAMWSRGPTPIREHGTTIGFCHKFSTASSRPSPRTAAAPPPRPGGRGLSAPPLSESRRLIWRARGLVHAPTPPCCADAIAPLGHSGRLPTDQIRCRGFVASRTAVRGQGPKRNKQTYCRLSPSKRDVFMVTNPGDPNRSASSVNWENELAGDPWTGGMPRVVG
jgi:hypothetical protein